jgi:Xaa-Pro aminopeptidase
MNAVCDHFSGDGFKTIRDLTKGDKESEKMGFVHSLGHGVGLTIGENPYLSLHSNDILKPGNVFTVEPGLYDQRFGGVRIEDVIALTESGIVNLTSYEKILEIRR